MNLFRNLQKGFTLIELLVVIGVLGILATGLLATIDPLEQFRKGADSNRKTTALELNNAITRYYSVHGTLPWDSVANGGANCNGGITPAATRVTNVTGASGFNDCLTTLANEGELKSTFATQYSILNKLYITETTPAGSTSKSVAVCYDPESKSESTRPETKYSQNPTGAACDPATSTTCYWCAQ
jgi:prepilin-type N-terminal cleavage/methylation domain-containing protein